MEGAGVHTIRRIAIKELNGFFGSYTALVFLSAFLAAIQFIFFWLDPFFARNSADLRPIFETMPTLLVFLCSALTMKMWSEERRSGTLELLLTLPVSNVEMVLGKFLACISIVLCALLLTIPLPISIALFAGPLDWGPVIGGYLASLFLAGFYISIGLEMSARTDNQVVSLILSMVVCGLFLIIGSPILTHFFTIQIGEVLALLGSGSRFESITRGVIDFRDIYYYVSLTCAFLTLNVLGLEKIRWAGSRSNESHRKWMLFVTLVLANFVVANLWLQNLSSARVDLTEGKIYTLSPATRKYLDSLQEPLLIRGYFSKRMHPLLQAVIPKLKDLLNEYQAAAPQKVRVEFFDPDDDPKIEKEVLEAYGIRPAPFQLATKYQSSVVNAYCDVVITYGDQYKKLNWQDLVKLSAQGQGLVADLRNPEYDFTSAIKRLVSDYEANGDLSLVLDQPVRFTGYISADGRLPAPFIQVKKELSEVLTDLVRQSKGKLSFTFVDPGAPVSGFANELSAKYGYRPMSLAASGQAPFFFYMTLSSDKRVIQIPLENPATYSGLKHSLTDALKKFARGGAKKIGIYQGLKQRWAGLDARADPCKLLSKRLSDEYLTEEITLDSGSVPSDIDLLLVVAPETIKDQQLVALDQFLMRGGTLVIATSPFDVSFDQNLSCHRAPEGLLGWLRSYGIEVQRKMVLDPQNFPLITPSKRMVNRTEVTERRMAPYPYSVDVTKEGLNTSSGVTAGINQLLFSWCSPITVNQGLNQKRKTYELLRSSANSWTSTDLNLNPQYSTACPLGFKPGLDRGRKLLAVAVEGNFDSYYNHKLRPSLRENNEPGDHSVGQANLLNNFIERSPQSAKIIVFASNTFMTDRIIYLMSSFFGTLSLEPIDIIQNSIDWSLDDRELLAIRGRGNFVRALYPPTPGVEMLFEYMNYGFAIVGLSLLLVSARLIANRKLKALNNYLPPRNSQTKRA